MLFFWSITLFSSSKVEKPRYVGDDLLQNCDDPQSFDKKKTNMLWSLRDDSSVCRCGTNSVIHTV